MIRALASVACAATALAACTPSVLLGESAFDSSTLDSPLGQPIFGSPNVMSEAERSLTPQIQRVPLSDAMDSTLSRRDDFRITAGSPPARTAWERRAFVTAALVALACALLGALAALMTIARSR